jgi:multiple antibiotic resistance protein
MERLAFIFTIFFLTLGPLKVIPVFYRVTADATDRYRRKAALRSTIIASIIVIVLALLGRNIVKNWHVSADSLLIAGGLLLLIAALKVLSQFTIPKHSKSQQPPPEEEIENIAISPLAIPGIITPYGVVAILVTTGNAGWDIPLQTSILGMLLLVMFLNYLGMIFARPIINRLQISTLLMIGWVFAVMQAALAIEFIGDGLRGMGVLPS